MTRSTWLIFGLLVLAAAVYCPMLFTGLDQWGRGDWDQFTFRYATPRVAMLRDGQLPTWNPYVNGGNVLLAHPHCPALSPWYLPTLVFGAPLGLRVGVVLFMAVGAVGMAVLLGRWGVSSAGCLLGGVLLMMSAHFAMHVTEGHLEWCLLGLMPWVLWCLVRAVDQWRFVILGALVLASALLHGSIYIVVVFAPLLVVWAALESVRTRSWRSVASCAALLGLTFLLGAVVLYPRFAFLRTNPRKTELHEQVAPAAVARMLLDPRQADLFRATRDVRNPPAGELAKILPSLSSSLAQPYEALKWHRLEVEASTTSDWTDIRIEGSPFVLVPGGPEQADEVATRLDSIPPSTRGLAIKNPRGDSPVAKKGRATIFARLPEQGDLLLAVTRGNVGATKVTIQQDGKVLLETIHAEPVPDDLSNRRVYPIARGLLLESESAGEEPGGTWCRLEAVLKTTADWCNVQVVNGPYLFCVEQPATEAESSVRLSATSLAIDSRPPEQAQTALRAILLLRCPAQEDVRVRITQGRLGTSSLTFSTLQGDRLEATYRDTTGPGDERTREYVLPNRLLRERLQPQPTPWRWQLDELGMNRDWHEYGCYVTWLGLAMVLLGLVVSLRRQWPLIATGAVAALIAMGSALPVNLWALCKLLPMYGSLQVPSRFLVAVVFVMAICGGFGLDWLGRWAQRAGGVWLGRLLQVGIVLAIYAELAVLGWNLFGDIFVCPPRPVPPHEGDAFAQRFADDDIRYTAMYSAHYPYLVDNSGVLREYENIAIARGKIRLAGDPDYRGEAYLAGAHGTEHIANVHIADVHIADVRIDRWSMSRVRVALSGIAAPDRLVLNQNYFPGWKAIRRGADGATGQLHTERLPAEKSRDGLVSLAVRPGDREVEFYYAPDGFIWGAIVSGLTLLGCVGALLAGVWGRPRSWEPARLVARFVPLCGAVVRSRPFAYAATAAALNVPFLACHPGWTLVRNELVRSLAVNSVLFLVPGLPLVGVMIGRRWPLRWGLLWVMAASMVVFIVLLAGTHLVGLTAAPATIWNATWIITNAALVLNVLFGGPPAWGLRLQGRHTWVGLLLFAVAYPMFFHGATRVVPIMEDHDYEIQGTAYGLLTRLEMTLLTDRHTDYYFAHPPLLHAYVAASFLYYGQADELAYYDDAWKRVRLAKQAVHFEPAIDAFYCAPQQRELLRHRPADGKDVTRHRIVGVEGTDYLVEPPLPQTEGWISGDRVPVEEMEVQMLYRRFQSNPQHRLATRTANVFLAAVTVGLLGSWIARMTGHRWLALLVPMAYATSPEVFVRSSYGGYFAISNFALLQVLLAVDDWTNHRGRAASSCARVPLLADPVVLGCLLAGAFAGLANHKLVLLPVAVVAWGMMRSWPPWSPASAAKALLHPVAIGFAVGTAVFWAYGLAVSPEMFLLEHVHHHLIDRVTHVNPLGYANYPAVPGLWLEFCRHTAYVLLPLGLLSLGVLCCKRDSLNDGSQAEAATLGWRGAPGLWTVWTVLTVVAFSLIDWRQTKHLMPLMLPLHLAPARWAASGRIALVLVGVLLVGLLLWNLDVLRALTVDFNSLRPTPDW